MGSPRSQTPEEYPTLPAGMIYETMFPAWKYNNSNFPDTKEGWNKKQENQSKLSEIKKKYGSKQFNAAWTMYQKQIKEDKPSIFSRAKKALGFKKGGSVGKPQRWANARKNNG